MRFLIVCWFVNAFFYRIAMLPMCRMTDDAEDESRVIAIIDIGCSFFTTWNGF